jgi:cysteinyl-tRNA synthetase
MARIGNYKPEIANGKQKEVIELIDATKETFEKSMNDDFETSKALAACFDLIKEINRRIDANDLTRDSQEMLMTFLMRLDSVFGIFISSKPQNIDHQISDLIEAREKARLNKDFKEADRIRNDLLAQGIKLEDTPNGTIWKRI